MAGWGMLQAGRCWNHAQLLLQTPHLSSLACPRQNKREDEAFAWSVGGLKALRAAPVCGSLCVGKGRSDPIFGKSHCLCLGAAGWWMGMELM